MALQTCRKCQTQNSEGAERCSQCGERLRQSKRMGFLGLLVAALLTAGGLGLLYFKVWPMVAGGAEKGVVSTDASGGALMERDVEIMSDAFRLPKETVRSVSALWAGNIRGRHPDHEPAEIVGAVAFSVRTHGTRGSIRSYYEEYWALADGGREPEQIRTLLSSQMFRGR